MILRVGAQLGFEGPEAFILSKNLASTLVDTEIIVEKLVNDLCWMSNPAGFFLQFTVFKRMHIYISSHICNKILYVFYEYYLSYTI